MRVKLTVSRGSNAGKAFDVNVPQFVIGRAKGCQLRPQSDAISRQHCVITVTQEGVTIRDLGSRNGTIVNGEKIEGTFKLSHGDDLRVGPLFLTVDLQLDETPTPPADTETLAAASEETIATTPKQDSAPEPMPTQAMPVQSRKTSDSADDIGAWLEEEERTDDTKIRNAETRRFRLDENERIEIQKAAEDTEEAEKADSSKDKKKKREPGKLPTRKEEVTKDSREAAEASLRKMFNRGL